MDILLMNDRTGPLNKGGSRKPRFIVAGRRARGNEEATSGLSDTYLSAEAGCCLRMDSTPLKSKIPINNRITGTSGDQNSFFLHTRPSAKVERNFDGDGIRSARSLYNERCEKEFRSRLGKAQTQHIGATGAVLVECTPRSAR